MRDSINIHLRCSGALQAALRHLRPPAKGILSSPNHPSYQLSVHMLSHTYAINPGCSYSPYPSQLSFPNPLKCPRPKYKSQASPLSLKNTGTSPTFLPKEKRTNYLPIALMIIKSHSSQARCPRLVLSTPCLPQTSKPSVNTSKRTCARALSAIHNPLAALPSFLLKNQTVPYVYVSTTEL